MTVYWHPPDGRATIDVLKPRERNWLRPYTPRGAVVSPYIDREIAARMLEIHESMRRAGGGEAGEAARRARAERGPRGRRRARQRAAAGGDDAPRGRAAHPRRKRAVGARQPVLMLKAGTVNLARRTWTGRIFDPAGELSEAAARGGLLELRRVHAATTLQQAARGALRAALPRAARRA